VMSPDIEDRCLPLETKNIYGPERWPNTPSPRRNSQIVSDTKWLHEGINTKWLH